MDFSNSDREEERWEHSYLCRLCKLNAITTMDAYPMPRVDELIDRLGKATYITTLDLARGYWQVPVSEKDRLKTAFITPKVNFG